jgi:hypothetical protein
MAEIISHAVWLYHVFSLSLRDVELILSERGIRVTHESIRRWGLKFGPEFATRMRRRRPGQATLGTLMRCICASMASLIISGVQWTSTASCSTSWSRNDGMRPRPSAFLQPPANITVSNSF